MAEQTLAKLSEELEFFLKGFRDKNGVYKYRDRIGQMKALNQKSLLVDHNDIAEFSPIMEGKLREEPDDFLHAFGDALYSTLKLEHPDYAEKIHDDIRIRIGNFPGQRTLRDVDAELIGKLVSVSGMVVRASEVKPMVDSLAFRCPEGHIQYVEQKDLEIKKTTHCNDCQNEAEIDLVKSKFNDFQIVRMQELPEDLPPGQLPHYSDIMLTHDLVDNARPGDRIILTGIVRIEQDYENIKIKIRLFRLRLQGNNIEFLGGRIGDKDVRTTERLAITTEDEIQIKRMASGQDAYEKLIVSVGPHVYGHDIIKEAILLQIIGAPGRELEDGTKIRGDINVFLVGDPGTAKSELLKYAARVAPRGLYTSGRGSTAAGLTAAVIRDKSGMLMLEAGAVVLGDQGLVCIDEFDKMKPEDRSALHEVMEQQTCSVAKGGIVATLNARTSILAAANPLLGKYDPFRNITENVNLPIPLLTRFDLVFAIRDEPKKEADSQIARHILGMHRRGTYAVTPILDIDMLGKYLAYSKRVDPVLSQEAEDKIFDYYLQMRNVESEDMITVTPRQLEALVRLATARARLLLKDEVDVSDAERAVYLVSNMLHTVGVDVKTGKVDLGVMHGMPQSERSKMEMFYDAFSMLAGPDKNPVEGKQLIDDLVKTNKFTEEEVKSLITRANRNGTIYEVKSGFYKRA
ncbi:MAG: ATPase [Thaumarchaeota archaeon]|nr:ATPase [Nitrososphaerota archaeon]